MKVSDITAGCSHLKINFAFASILEAPHLSEPFNVSPYLI